MINFFANLYRSPKPGSVCWDVKIHRYVNCLSGAPRAVFATFILVVVVVALVVLVGLAVDMIRGRI